MPSRLVALLVASALVAGCGGGDSEPPDAARSKPVQPLGGNLLNAVSLEPIGGRGASVPAGASKKVSFAFGSVKAGSVILITDKPKDLKASIGGVPLQKGDMFGAPAFFLSLANPGTVMVTLTNEGNKPAAASIQFFGASKRKIELDVEPGVVQPGEPVTFTAKVTEPTDADVIQVRVLRDHRVVAELEPDRIDDRTWQTTFTVEGGGFYAVTARVIGGPPRELSGIEGFEVAHRGTVVTGYDESTRDPDRDGLIDWLILRLHVTVTAPGQYMTSVALADRAGKSLAGCSGDHEHLARGKHVLALRCYGPSIAATGIDGPYGIRHVQLTRVKPDFRNETDIRDLGRTRPYRSSDFEPIERYG
jgi:hypothetical protein